MTGYNDPVNYNAAINYNGGASPVPAIIGGHFLPAHNKKKRTLSNVQIIYNKAKQLARKDTKELRDAISDFVEPAIARQIFVPDLEKINYEALEANKIAYEKFEQALLNIEQSLIMLDEQNQDDDELLLLATITCLIH